MVQKTNIGPVDGYWIEILNLETGKKHLDSTWRAFFCLWVNLMLAFRLNDHTKTAQERRKLDDFLVIKHGKVKHTIYWV